MNNAQELMSKLHRLKQALTYILRSRTDAKSCRTLRSGIQTFKQQFQLIQETINHISSKFSLHKDTPRTPQNIHMKLYNQQGYPKVSVDDKEHSLPTTKEYILKEYADMFTGIGTLLGPAYHIEFKR